MISACIFDLDGVIVDTAHYHYQAWKRLAHGMGIDLSPAHNERLKGVSRMESLAIILDIGGIEKSTEEREKLATQKNSWFNEYIEKMLPEEIFPGVRRLIENLKASGKKVALASSSRNARKVVKRLQIEDMFDAFVDGTMITNTKPDPEIFLSAARLLNTAPENCLVFEDAEAGVEAAIAAGMKCVGIGSAEQLGKADLVLRRTADFSVERAMATLLNGNHDPDKS